MDADITDDFNQITWVQMAIKFYHFHSQQNDFFKLAARSTDSPLREVKLTRPNKYVWISKCHSGGEILATILHVTLPVHKLMLLSLKHTHRVEWKLWDDCYVPKKNVWEVLYTSTDLNGYFGAHSSHKLVNDLSVQAACIVHVSNHHWEWLSDKKQTLISCQVVQTTYAFTCLCLRV